MMMLLSLLQLLVLVVQLPHGYCGPRYHDQEEENQFKVPWGNIYQHLLDIANTGLQAQNIQEDLYNNFEWEYKHVDGTQLLQERLDVMKEITSSNLESVWLLRQTIIDHFDAFMVDTPPLVPRERNCCNTIEEQHDGCITTAAANETGLVLNTPRQVLEQLHVNHEKYTLSLVQYFALHDGSLLMYPADLIGSFETCTSFDPRRRSWYVESESPYSRDVVLLIDQTSAVTHPALLLATINRLIDCITSSDRIVVVPSGDIAETGKIQSNWWSGNTLAGLGVWMDGHESLKDKLRQLVKIEVASITNSFASHVDALHWAEDLLYSKPSYPLMVNRDAVDIVVMVTGRPGWASWRGNRELNDNVNKLMLVNVTLIVIPLEGAVDNDGIAEGIPRSISEPSLHIAPITSIEHLDRANLARYFTSYESRRVTENNHSQSLLSDAVITVPYYDAFGASLIISVCLPININDTFWGSVCNDVSVVNLFESIMTVLAIQDAYVFMMDTYGRVILHPLLPSPTKLNDHPLFLQMTEVEQNKEVYQILQHMVDGRSGSKVIVGHLIRNVGRPFQINLPNAVSSTKTQLKYLWGPVEETRLSLAVVLPLQKSQATSVRYKCRTEELCGAPHFQYHRWDLDTGRKPDTCRFFGMEAVKNNALVKFAPSSFRDILNYLKHEDNATVSRLYGIFRHNEAIAGFLVDNGIREGVALGERTEEYWRNTGTITQFIGARYIATSSGVFVVYPGTQLPTQTYDARQRPWYLRAVDGVDIDPVVTLSPPYCDSFGAGLIVTASMALTSPTEPKQVVAVVAGDFTSQYLNDNFVQQLSDCDGKFTCFMVDKSGYVVMHTKWQHVSPLHPTKCEVPIHGAHINIVEPVIGRKLAELNILRRRGCHDYANSDLFLFWTIELPRYQTQVITQDFALNHVPFTNLFLIVYKPFTSRPRGCLCPKSWVPGQPLRCRNTCVDFCECPCLATLNTKRCAIHDNDILKDKLPACWPRTPVAEHHPTSFAEHLKSIPPCNTYNCTAPDRRSCSRMSMACFWYKESCHDLNSL